MKRLYGVIDVDSDILYSGALELAAGTALLVDETQLETG